MAPPLHSITRPLNSSSRLLLRHTRPKPTPSPTQHAHHPPFRTLLSPPTASTGPLMTRRSDRALPPLPSPLRTWARTAPLFLATLGLSTLLIFNYQKSNSAVVGATLYALRTNEKARELLGEEIYFKSLMPWVWGTVDVLHGKVDVRFMVKGKSGVGEMRFRSLRRGRGGRVGFFF